MVQWAMPPVRYHPHIQLVGELVSTIAVTPVELRPSIHVDDKFLFCGDFRECRRQGDCRYALSR